MGDRFYEQQNQHFNRPRGTKRMTEKKKRRLKKDALEELAVVMNLPVAPEGLTKMTIADIDNLKYDIADAIEQAEKLAFQEGERSWLFNRERRKATAKELKK